jgi:hypothetical protein
MEQPLRINAFRIGPCEKIRLVVCGKTLTGAALRQRDKEGGTHCFELSER